MTLSKPIVPYGKRASIIASLKMLLVLFLSGANSLRYGILWLLFKRHRRQSLRLHMFAAASRTVLHLMRADDLQMIVGLRTLAAELETPFYRPLVKKALGFNNQLPKTEAPKHGAKLAPGLRAPDCVWLWEVKDRQPNDPVIFYCHGGGYAIGMNFAQVYWITDLAKALAEHRVSVLALDYSLSPYARYPTQLHEAFVGFEALAETCNRIIPLGDSAGGNLIGALALTLKDYPDLYSKLYGQVFVSPWAELIPQQDGSIHDNSQSDWVTGMFGARCAGWFVGEDIQPDADGVARVATKDPKADLVNASGKMLSSAFPKNTACVWSANELLADSIDRFCYKANINDKFVEEGHIHDITYFGHNNDSSRFVVGVLNKWLGSEDQNPEQQQSKPLVEAAPESASKSASESAPESAPKPVSESSDSSKEQKHHNNHHGAAHNKHHSKNHNKHHKHPGTAKDDPTPPLNKADVSSISK